MNGRIDRNRDSTYSLLHKATKYIFPRKKVIFYMRLLYQARRITTASNLIAMLELCVIFLPITKTIWLNIWSKSLWHSLIYSFCGNWYHFCSKTLEIQQDVLKHTAKLLSNSVMLEMILHQFRKSAIMRFFVHLNKNYEF